MLRWTHRTLGVRRIQVAADRAACWLAQCQHYYPIVLHACSAKGSIGARTRLHARQATGPSCCGSQAMGPSRWRASARSRRTQLVLGSSQADWTSLGTGSLGLP